MYYGFFASAGFVADFGLLFFLPCSYQYFIYFLARTECSVFSSPRLNLAVFLCPRISGNGLVTRQYQPINYAS